MAYFVTRAAADGMYAIEAADGLLMAMQGYFDDSNTHAGAPFFMWAGLSGHKEHGDIAESARKTVLAERGLKRYVGEFDFRCNARGVSDAARANAALRGIEGKHLTYR